MKYIHPPVVAWIHCTNFEQWSLNFQHTKSVKMNLCTYVNVSRMFWKKRWNFEKIHTFCIFCKICQNDRNNVSLVNIKAHSCSFSLNVTNFANSHRDRAYVVCDEEPAIHIIYRTHLADVLSGPYWVSAHDSTSEQYKRQAPMRITSKVVWNTQTNRCLSFMLLTHRQLRSVFGMNCYFHSTADVCTSSTCEL